MIDNVKHCADELLRKDKTGHGIDHIERVLKMSLKFATTENANIDIVSLIAILHDADDYKLFGQECSENLTNAKYIMEECSIDDDIKKYVLNGIQTIGYSKRLKGIIPTNIEAMIVSDADMCDAIGVTGILRTYQYNIKKGNPFFDKDMYPIEEITASEYMKERKQTAVIHMFEKLLKIKNLMLTSAGREEAIERHDIMVRILYQFFKEQNVPECG